MIKLPRRSYYRDFTPDPIARRNRRDANRMARIEVGLAELEKELAATEAKLAGKQIACQ